MDNSNSLESTPGQNEAISESYRQLWQDPSLESRIENGIREHRMGELQLRLVDEQNRPVPGAAIEIRQVKHEFLFGSNIFLLGQFGSAEKNAKYEAVFGELWNAATVPFYWMGVEPEPGKLRFDADSEPIHRRPPPDVAVEFCTQRGLNMNGHPLVWHSPQHFIPSWLPAEPRERERLFRQRIEIIAERYGKTIPRWDVVNEPCDYRWYADTVPMPDDYEWMAFEEAAKWLPREAVLMINETNPVWRKDREMFMQLVKRLRERGAKIDGVGLQLHLFKLTEMRRVQDGELFPPSHILEVLDYFAELKLPLHVSEVTIPALSNSAEARAAQAEVARNFYRLWFSHPAVNAVTWWNLTDGGGTPKEQLFSGLLDAECEPKPAYEALDQLINHEWKTSEQSTSDERGMAQTHAFYGDYEITVSQGGKSSSHAVTFSRSQCDTIEIRLEQ